MVMHTKKRYVMAFAVALMSGCLNIDAAKPPKSREEQIADENVFLACDSLFQRRGYKPINGMDEFDTILVKLDEIRRTPAIKEKKVDMSKFMWGTIKREDIPRALNHLKLIEIEAGRLQEIEIAGKNKIAGASSIEKAAVEAQVKQDVEKGKKALQGRVDDFNKEFRSRSAWQSFKGALWSDAPTYTNLFFRWFLAASVVYSSYKAYQAIKDILSDEKETDETPAVVS